jgi:hypothetical protein
VEQYLPCQYPRYTNVRYPRPRWAQDDGKIATLLELAEAIVTRRNTARSPRQKGSPWRDMRAAPHRLLRLSRDVADKKGCTGHDWLAQSTNSGGRRCSPIKDERLVQENCDYGELHPTLYWRRHLESTEDVYIMASSPDTGATCVRVDCLTQLP